MSVRVEFYGLPRARAGVAETLIDTGGIPIRLGDMLAELAARFPALAETCIAQEQLRHGYTMNLDGGSFVTDPETRVRPGQTLLLMSADAGG